MMGKLEMWGDGCGDNFIHYAADLEVSDDNMRHC